jgi:hypothetical protein
MPTAERIGLKRAEVVATIKSAANQPLRNPTTASGNGNKPHGRGQLADMRMSFQSAIPPVTNGSH